MARYKLRVGRRINSGTLIADAKHSWLEAHALGREVADRVARAMPDVRSITWSARAV